MMKSTISLIALLALNLSVSATCYNICLGNGNYYIMYTDPENPANTTCQLIGTGCKDGPWIHECPALVSNDPDESATEAMMQLDPDKFRPSTPEEHEMFLTLLKQKPIVTYPDLNKLSRETIDWIRSH